VIAAEEGPIIHARLYQIFAGTFASLWRRLSASERTALAAIAAGEVPIVDAPRLAPAPMLHSLINRGYIVCEQGRYRLFAGLFRDYVLGQADTEPPQSQRASPVLDERELTELEKQLLAVLKARSGEPVDRDTIVEKLYGARPGRQGARQYDNRIDALIFRLRGKLDRQPVLIESIRGQGCRLVWTKSSS
jgi:hypothetical protein